MLARLLLITALVSAIAPARALKPSELERLDDALRANLYAIEVMVFLRDPSSVNSTEPLVEELVKIWPNTLMAMSTQRSMQRMQSQKQIWSNEINGQHCLRQAAAATPDFMRPVLAQGFESELLNEFSKTGSQVTLTPPLTDAEKNPHIFAALQLMNENPADAIEPPSSTITFSALQQAERSFWEALKDFNESFAKDSWLWLEDEHLELGPQRQSIARAPELNVVFHGRWQQPVPARDAPQYIQIPIHDPVLQSQHQQLSGHIGITLGRYLHANTNLWLQADPTSGQYAVLNESRRMRSDELHYVDHPLMGVLIKIMPVEPSNALKQSWQALQNAKS